MQLGAYLIGAGVHPKIDDRIELYGDQPLVFDYRFLDENRVDWTFFEIEVYPQLEQALNTDPKWVSLYRGPIFPFTPGRARFWMPLRAAGREGGARVATRLSR
jgi:hypothetical protein